MFILTRYSLLNTNSPQLLDSKYGKLFPLLHQHGFNTGSGLVLSLELLSVSTAKELVVASKTNGSRVEPRQRFRTVENDKSAIFCLPQK